MKWCGTVVPPVAAFQSVKGPRCASDTAADLASNSPRVIFPSFRSRYLKENADSIFPSFRFVLKTHQLHVCGFARQCRLFFVEKVSISLMLIFVRSIPDGANVLVSHTLVWILPDCKLVGVKEQNVASAPLVVNHICR